VLLLIRKDGKILLTPSERVRGFWDLPEPFLGARLGGVLGTFRHSIMNTQYVFEVQEAIAGRVPRGGKWWEESRLTEIPLSTTTKKALRLL
jgi:hypothetical protein